MNALSKLFVTLLGVAFASGDLKAQVTREEQKTLTPSAAFERLIAGNERFLAGKLEHRDLLAAAINAAKGQFPASVVISCLDSRTAPEIIFDQGPGDLFVGRIAGNFVDDVMLGSIEFATKVSKAPLIVILGHTDCGAIKGAADGVKLGHLTATLNALEPAIKAVPADVEPRNSANKKYVQLITQANVRIMAERVKTQSDGLASKLAKGTVGIIGGVYDLSTGKIEWMSETAINVTPPAEKK